MSSRSRSLTGSGKRDAILFTASGATLATLVPVALHQVGAIPHLPDPPGSAFDSDRITDSKVAHPFGVPDGLLGLASFGTTFALLFAARRNRLARLALGGKLAFDAGFAGFNLVRQVVQFRQLCSWCTGTALAALTTAGVGKMLIADAASEAVALVEAD